MTTQAVIVHLADIHIRLYLRHDEYQRVFDALREQIAAMSVHSIVICGDIFHQKVELTPESIVLAVRWLHQLGQIAPTIVIAGNHDMLQNNAHRLDTLSALFHQRHIPNVVYLRKSGWYCQTTAPGILYRLDSIWQDPTPNQDAPPYLGDTDGWQFSASRDAYTCDRVQSISIGIYHGGVGRYRLQNRFEMEGEMSLDHFKDLDWVLLGDIHVPQILQQSPKRPTIAYAGSLLSQNVGEGGYEHGFLVWHLDDRARPPTFCTVPNPEAHVDVTVQGDTMTWYENEEPESCRLTGDPTTLLPSNFPAKARVNVCLMDDTWTPMQLRRWWTKARPNASITIRELGGPDRSVLLSSDTFGNDTSESHVSPDSQRRKHIAWYAEPSLRSRLTELLPSSAPTDWVDRMLDIMRPVLRDMSASSSALLSHRTNQGWQIQDLKVKNMFAYKELDMDFSKWRPGSVIGIFGPNSSGKSCLIDVLSMLLFSKITRYQCGNSIPSEVIHAKESTATGSLSLMVDGVPYRIEKKYTRMANGKIKCDDHLYCRGVPVTQEHRVKTQTLLGQLIGSFDTFHFLCVQSQQPSASFRSMTQAQRKDFLVSHFQLNCFDTLRQEWKERCRSQESLVKRLQSSEWAALPSDWIAVEAAQLEQKQARLEERDALYQASKQQLETERGQFQSSLSQDVHSLSQIRHGLHVYLEERDKDLLTSQTNWDVEHGNRLYHLEELQQTLQREQSQLRIESFHFPMAMTNMINNASLPQWVLPPPLRSTTDNDARSPCAIDGVTVPSKVEEWLERQNMWAEERALLSLQVEQYHQALRAWQKECYGDDHVPNGPPPGDDGNECDQEANGVMVDLAEAQRAFDSRQEVRKQEMVELTEKMETCSARFESSAWQRGIDRAVTKCREKEEMVNSLTLAQKEMKNLQKTPRNPACAVCMASPVSLQIKEREKQIERWRDQISFVEKELQDMYQTILNSCLDILPTVAQRSGTVDAVKTYRAMEDMIRKYVASLQKAQARIKQEEQKDAQRLAVLRWRRFRAGVDQLGKPPHLSCLDDQRPTIHPSVAMALRASWVYWKQWKDNTAHMESRQETCRELERQIGEAVHAERSAYWCLQKNRWDQSERLREEIRVRTTALEALQREREAYVAEKTQLQITQQSFQERQKSFQRFQQEYAQAQQDLAFQEAFVKLLSRDGLANHVLRELLPQLEWHWNRVIRPFWPLERVRLGIVDESMDIDFALVHTDGTSSTRFFGGMESFLLHVSSKIALHQVAQRPPPSFFVLDEGISVMDAERLQELPGFFAFLQTMFQTIWVISHIPAVQDMVDVSLKIERRNGYSYLTQQRQ